MSDAAKIKITNLPPALALSDNGTDKFIVIIDGKLKLVTVTTFFSNIRSDVTINPALGDVDFTMNGQAKANLFKLDAGLAKIGIGTGVPEALLHIAGDVKIGGTGAGKNGVLTLSNEVLEVGTTSAPITVSNSFSLSTIKTISTSSSLSYFELGAPTAVNQTKTIILSDTHVDKSSGLNYYITTTNVLSNSSIKLNKLGDSATFVSVMYGATMKWALTSYIGATVV